MICQPPRPVRSADSPSFEKETGTKDEIPPCGSTGKLSIPPVMRVGETSLAAFWPPVGLLLGDRQGNVCLLFLTPGRSRSPRTTDGREKCLGEPGVYRTLSLRCTVGSEPQISVLRGLTRASFFASTCRFGHNFQTVEWLG